MQLEAVSNGLKWLEHKTKPIFVAVALILYAVSLIQLAFVVSPITQLGLYLEGALANLSIPFGIILLQEMLELIANIGDNNLLSARHQFEIVVLVIVRSFFKSFSKVSGYVSRAEFGEPVQESIVKIVAIIVLMLLIFAFRRMAESQYLRTYVSGQRANKYKQVLVVLVIFFVIINMIMVQPSAEETTYIGELFTDSIITEFIRQVFTGIIIIDAMFLIIAIMMDSRFLTLAFESTLIIGLIFARLPLFSSSILSYALSVIGVGFATATLYVMYRVANIEHREMVASDVVMAGHASD